MNNSQIPLCVPYGGERTALDAGATWSKATGWQIGADEFLDPVWLYLPLKWRDPDRVNLPPELLPSSTWEDNLRSAVSQPKWDALRKACYAAAGYRCSICGSNSGALEAHEVWSFEPVWCVQSLEDLSCRCRACHGAAHWGSAGRRGILDEVRRKVLDVNRWNVSQLDRAVADAMRLADERSKFHWTVDISWLDRGDLRMVWRLDGEG